MKVKMKKNRIIGEKLYTAGEEYSFPKSVANQLIEQGIAEKKIKKGKE